MNRLVETKSCASKQDSVFWFCNLARKVKEEVYPDLRCDCICDPIKEDPRIDARIIEYIWSSVKNRIDEDLSY